MLKLKDPMKGFLKENPQWMIDRRNNQKHMADLFLDVGICTALQLIHEANPTLALKIVKSEEMSIMAADIVISLFEAERKQDETQSSK